MPEIPELTVIAEILERRVVGRRITGVQVLKPLVLRNLIPAESPESVLVGRSLAAARRHGKFICLDLDAADRHMVINFMLLGRLYLCDPTKRHLAKDHLALDLDNGQQLRYHDEKTMGKVYLVADLGQVPGLLDTGPDALDPDLTLERFLERLRPFRGEIKGVLTRGGCVAGIGNAYADEILFRAGIYPFRKRYALSLEEQTRLYHAMRDVLTESIPIVRELMGDDMREKPRRFLAVHGKKGQPCPVCGGTISEVRAARRGTNFCRTCQPGTLVRN